MITPFNPELDERVCSIAADDYENTLKATDHILEKLIKDPEGHVSRNLIYSSGSSYEPYGGGGGGGGYGGRGGGGGGGYRDPMEVYMSLYGKERDNNL